MWLLEELNLTYNLSIHKRTSEGLAGADLKKIHPLGKSPVISIQPSDESSPPRVIAESGAIVEYLSDYFGQHLIPKRWQEGKENQIGGETEEWTRYRFYMHYAEGSIMTLMILTLVVTKIKEAPVPFFIKPITKGVASKIEENFLRGNFATHYSFLEEQLATSGGDFICGKSLTGADILMQLPFEAGVDTTGLTKEKYPKIWAYMERLMARDAYKRAVDKIKDQTGKYESVRDV